MNIPLKESLGLVPKRHDPFLATLAQDLEASSIEEKVLHLEPNKLGAAQSCVKEKPDHSGVAAANLQIEVEARHQS
jgi:hypothetical protein